MRQKILLFTAFTGIAFLTLTAYKDGPGTKLGATGNRTGGPGSSGTCSDASCHAGASGLTTANFIFRKKTAGITSTPVTQFEPNQDYFVTVRVNNPNVDKTRFGFQLAALKSDGSSIGTFSNLGSNIHSVTVGGRVLIEHSVPLTKAAATDSVNFEWKAPAAGSGNVTFYGVVNAVNNDGSVLTDVPSTPLAIVFGDPASVNELANQTDIKTYPNPFSNYLSLLIENAIPGEYAITVYDMAGKKVLSKDAKANISVFQYNINTERWYSGVYFVSIKSEHTQQVIPVVKQ